MYYSILSSSKLSSGDKTRKNNEVYVRKWRKPEEQQHSVIRQHETAMAQTLRSCVWAYFQLVEGDNTKAICKVCQEDGARVLISRGGTNSKQFTTTNLRNHLRRHPKQFLELSSNDKERLNIWALPVQVFIQSVYSAKQGTFRRIIEAA